jgi:hypothetical protein
MSPHHELHQQQVGNDSSQLIDKDRVDNKSNYSSIRNPFVHPIIQLIYQHIGAFCFEFYDHLCLVDIFLNSRLKFVVCHSYFFMLYTFLFKDNDVYQLKLFQ